MTDGLKRYQQSKQSHFVTFSCYRRQPRLRDDVIRDIFVESLERTRRSYGFRVYEYAVMPEHVHLLISETEIDILATAIQALKIAVARRALHYQREYGATFWQKRYYDRNTRDYDEFVEKLRYIHRNPVKRGLVEEPGDWKWSSFQHYITADAGAVEIRITMDR